MRRISRETETETILKAVYSIIFGMSLSQLVGWSMSLTLCFACVLICYNNRGWYGSGLYYKRRMQTQVLMCILLFFALYTFRYFFPAAPLWLQHYIPMVLFAPLFLYLCYAHQFTPLNLTAVFSALMIMGTGVKDPEYFAWRVVLTFLGLILGWLIAVIYPFRSKLGRARESLGAISQRSLEELEHMLCAGRAGLGGEYTMLQKDISAEMAAIAAYLSIVYQDAKSPKYRCFASQIPVIKAEYASAAGIIELVKAIELGKAELNSMEDFRQKLLEEAVRVGRLHMSVLEGASPETQERAMCRHPEADSAFKIRLLSKLIIYKDHVLKIADERDYVPPVQKGEEAWTRKSPVLPE